MAELKAIVDFLDDLLETRHVPDRYCTNGLQVEAPGPVERVGFCVDACLETFQQLQDCQLVVVHHGLFWPSVERITGAVYRSLRFLIEHGMGLYCSHLPLDRHAELGNNAQLLKLLELSPGEPFPPVGWTAELPREYPLAELTALLEPHLPGLRVLPFGPERITRIAVSSGQAGTGMLADVARLGCQLFLTGEASHPIYHAAQEAGLHVLLGGHYGTETWGVKALMPVVAERFGVEVRYVDVPTGF